MCLPQGSLFKRRPCGPVLKGRQCGALGFWRSREWVRGSLVTGRGLSLRGYKNEVDDVSCLSQCQVFSRGLCRRMLPHFGEFRPISALRASLRSVALRNAPAGAGGGRPGAVRPGPGAGKRPQAERIPCTGRWASGMVLCRQVHWLLRSVKGRGIAPPCACQDSRQALSLLHIVKARSAG